MARPRQPVPTLTPHQAAFVLESAVADGRLSAADVNRYLARLPEHVSMLEAQLARLRGAVMEPVTRILHRETTPAPVSAVPPTKRQRRKQKQAANPSRQLQGQYIAYIRQVPEKDRSKYKAMVAKNGREATIAAIKKALGK